MKKFTPPKAPKSTGLPKSPKPPKSNVLGRLGRSQQPPGMARPGIIGEEEREQDSPLDEYVAPKQRKPRAP